MTDLYRYSRHERVQRRLSEGPPVAGRAASQGSSPRPWIARANSALGLMITRRVGTMWAAYVFALIALVSLPAALASGSALVIVAWIAQTFLQLVLLPVIIVGQNIQAAAADARATSTYEDAGAILDEAKEIQEHLAAQDRILAEIQRTLNGDRTTP